MVPANPVTRLKVPAIEHLVPRTVIRRRVPCTVMGQQVPCTAIDATFLAIPILTLVPTPILPARLHGGKAWTNLVVVGK